MAPHFSSAEDKRLCVAWTDITQDPIKGNNQKREDLWKAIAGEFNGKVEPDAGGYRNPEQLYNRFRVVSFTNYIQLRLFHLILLSGDSNFGE